MLIIGLLFVGVRIKTDEDDVLSRNNTDAIRYVCCFIVMYSHIMVDGANLYLGYLHFVAVTFFFILSGYGLTCSYLNNNDTFLKRHPSRIFKLLLMEVVVIIIQSLLKAPANRGGVFWFGVLILFYVVFGLSTLFRNSYVILGINILFTIVYVVLFQELVMIKGIDLGWTNYFGWAQQSVGFIVGILIGFNKSQFLDFIKKYRIVLVGVSIIALIPAGMIYIQPHDISTVTNVQFILREIISFSIFIITMVLLSCFKLGNRVICYIGSKLSLYIFAIHGIFINISEILFDKIDISFVILGSVVAAICLHMLIKFICDVMLD